MNKIISTLLNFLEIIFQKSALAYSNTSFKLNRNRNPRTGYVGKILCLFITLGFFHVAFSKEICPVNFRLETTSTSTVTIGQPSATGTLNITPPSGSYMDISINDVLTFGYDQNSVNYLATGTDVKIKVQVQQWDVNNNALATFSKVLCVKYHPNDTNQYKDKSIFLFHNAYTYQIVIDSIYVNGVSSTQLPKNFFVEMEISGQRYTDFSSTSSTQIPFTLDTLDLDCDHIMDQIAVTWSPISGAESYQLEWTYINDYGTTLTGYLSPSNVIYDFRNNATRITTVNTFYNVTNVFEHGYVLFRLRAIGNALTTGNPVITGVWNTTLDSGAVSGYSQNIHIVLEHEFDKNWQITASFAEEGKKKEVVSYFDGTLRNRQTVTQMNSDSTALVGQSIYDFQGRPAINILPAPVVLPSCSSAKEASIKYYPNFNRSGTDTAVSYSRLDFDTSSVTNTCGVATDSMSSYFGVSNYYSPKNPNQNGFQKYLPDAKDYPFSQVEYTPDNTGRIRRQSGVGPVHQLGTGHETQYFYGQPNQLELDRMFASEAGDASHYKKNIVVDANGQSSMTYMNLEGKTIATCLAGDTSLYTISINSGRQKPDSLYVDLFAKDANGISTMNTINVQQNGIEFNTQLLVAYTSNYVFDYNLRIDTLDDACLKSNVCFNCVYDLDIELLDQCGHKLDSVSKHVGKFSLDSTGALQFDTICSSPTTYTDSESFQALLTPGNYTLIKRLTVNNAALNYYVNAYMDTTINSCYKSLTYFQQQALASVDTMNCYISCDQCAASLGSRDSFVAAGKGTALKYDFLLQQCLDPCKPVSPCETALQMMLSDVSPTGQYGQFDSTTYSANAYVLSVFNDSTSRLPNGTTANWHHPQITLNGNTYTHYVDEYGDVSTVGITLDTTGHYYPAVIDTNLVYADTSANFYTFPENLVNLKDFIAAWQSEWSNSLVQYHPEYCYYNTCLQYETPDSSADIYTSEGFDQLLQKINTFHDAVTYGLIIPTYSTTAPSGSNPEDYSTRLTDWFNFPTVSPITPYDPLVVYSHEDHYDGIGKELLSKFQNYTQFGGTNYNMVEMASYTARCANLVGVAPTINCFQFGSDFSSPSTAPVNDSIRNLEWSLLRNFYLSTKQQLINKRYDSVAIYECESYNNCIGNTNFNAANNNFANAPNGFYSTGNSFPCTQSNMALYVNKQKRFITSPSDFGFSTDPSVNAAQIYANNIPSQCPITYALQNFLSSLAKEDSLGSNLNLLNYGPYTNLYLATQGAFEPSPPTTYPPITNSYYKWIVDTTSNHDLLQAQFVNPVTNYSCALTIDKTGSGVTHWNSIAGFDSLYATSTNPSVTQTFKLLAKLVFVSSPSTGSYDSAVYVNMTGTMGNCFNIVSCSFNTSSTPTPFATDINLLMTSLANNNDLTNSNVNLEVPLYTPLITPTILNEVGTPNSNLVWNYNPTLNLFTLFDATNPACGLSIAIQQPYPSLAALDSITSFQDIGSYNNSTSSSQLDGYDAENKLITTLIITVTHSCGSGTSTGAAMNSNLPPVPGVCMGNQYQATNQLVPLVEDLLIHQFVPDSTINIVGSPYFTGLLQTYFPNAASEHFTYSTYSYTPGSFTLYNDSLDIIMPGCNLNLYTHKHANHNFNLKHLYNINSFGYLGLTLTGPVDANGAYHDFYMPVVYAVDTIHTNTNGCGPDTIIKYVNDTIFGTTCLPLQICNVCTNGLSASNGMMQYQSNGMGACDSTTSVPPTGPPIPPIPPSQDPCVQQLLQAATATALNLYNNYVDSITTAIGAKYMAHCLNPFESFFESYKDKQYHYTLYYYDQAGNLVKTIPPEGVNLMPFTSSTAPLEERVIADRTNKTHTVFTAHVLQTNYEYNSLNQLTRQYMPDHDKMNIFETTLPNGLNTQLVVTGIQFVTPSKGFLSGYVAIGEGLKRGYNYTSNDGGQTWVRLTNMVASDLHKVQMVDADRGYAVGNEGTIVRTVDGGQNWDMLNTFSTNIIGQFTGLYFKDSLNGVFIGNNQNILATSDGGLTFNASITATPSFVTTDSLTSISYDGSSFVLSLLRRGTSLQPANYAVIYSSNSTGTTWTQDSVNTGNLHDVCIYNNASNQPEAYAVGDNGVLLHKPATENNWYMIPASVANAFRSVYFINVNEGIALIDSVPGYAQIYRTSNAGLTWTLLSNKGQYYNQISPYEVTTGGAKLVGVGKKGLVSRIIIYTGTPFGIITLNSPAPSANLTACWGTDFTSGSQKPVWFLIGDDAGNIYYTYNASNPTVNWGNPTGVITYTLAPNPSTILTNTFGIAQIEAIQDTVTSPSHGRIISANILTADGSVYYLYKGPSAITASSFSTNVVSPPSSSVAFSKLAFDNVNNIVYAYSNGTKALYTGTLVPTGYTSSLSPFVSGTTNMGAINAISSFNYTNFIAVGNAGVIKFLNPSTSTHAWSDQTNKIIPNQLNGIGYNSYVPKTAYAVGNNGLFLQRYAAQQWQVLSNGFAKELNTIAFSSLDSGLVAGNSGKLYHYSIASGVITTTVIPITTTNNLNEIAINGTQAYVAGANGTLLYSTNANSVTPVFTVIPTTLTGKLNSISFIPSSGGNAIAVGDNATVNLLTGTTRVNIKNVFTPALRDINSLDGQELYTVGDYFTIRHSLDGGITWDVVLPTASNPVAGFNFNKVKVTAANTAYIVGNNSYFGVTNSSNQIAPIALTSSNNAGNMYSLSGTASLNDINTNSNGIQYIVGEDSGNGVAITYTPTAGGTWAYLAPLSSLTSTPLKALWVFNNNGMLTTGGGGYVGYFNGTLPTGNSTTSFSTGTAFLPLPANYNNTTFTDIYFHDDYTGYLVGKGVLLKTSNTSVNDTTYVISGFDWQALNINDSLLQQFPPDSMCINTIAFSTRYYGFMGGRYSNTMQTGVQNNYARVLHDESLYFSGRFWYDRLGRLTLSQNTKQFNKSPQALSYTTYDALGRITEVGELAMNNRYYNLNSVFGTYINDYYNPLVINDTSLTSFLNHNPRTEVTHTYYDTLAIDSLPVNFMQNNLRKRVSSVTYEDTYDGNPQTYNHATHYSYDVHGNVNTVIQDNPSLSSIKQRFKRTDFDYDLVANKINDIYYQHDSADAFTHHYCYDADNRITEVYTSRFPQAQWAGYKDAFWDRDAKYYYYKHGPLARTEIGDERLQGIDYAYTIQGWVKGVNSEILQPENDMGKDGLVKNGNHNKHFARDAYGYSLTYFNGDYAAIGNNWKSDSLNRFTAGQYGSTGVTDVNANRYNLYDGNIGSVITSVTNPTNKISMPQANSYRYDQLNRIVEARSFQDIKSTTNTWGNEYLNNSEKAAYFNNFSYDANGNILSQYRTDVTGNGIDSLIYNYAHDSNNELFQNRLYSVNDKVAANKFSDDIDDQGVFNDTLETINAKNNYSYDAIGQLVKDSAEQIESIEWNMYGKVKSIQRYFGSSKLNLVFDYDVHHQRISKHLYTSANVWVNSTYYVRDLQGKIASVYQLKPNGASLAYRITEHDIYGGNRVGVSIDSMQLIGASPDTISYSRVLGQKEYELTSHLGSVISIVNDRKIAQAPAKVLNIYSSPILSRVGIDSLGGLKIQPIAQNGGNTFAVKTVSGQNYQADFYVNLANTQSGDGLSFDYPSSVGNSLASTGHYTFNFTASDTLSNLVAYYSSTGNTPNDYFMFDSLNVINTSIINDSIKGYRANLANVSDYYPFGAPMLGRQYSQKGSYRYGFNTQEKDDEIAGKGNINTAEFWEYDTRLGRRWNMDPVLKPEESPYAVFSNNPIWHSDVNGDDANNGLNKKEERAAKKFEKKVNGALKELKQKNPEATTEDAIAKVIGATKNPASLYLVEKGGDKNSVGIFKYKSIPDLFRVSKGDKTKATNSSTETKDLVADPKMDSKTGPEGFTTMYHIPEGSSDEAKSAAIIITNTSTKIGYVDVVMGNETSDAATVDKDKVPVGAAPAPNSIRIVVPANTDYVMITERIESSDKGVAGKFQIQLQTNPVKRNGFVDPGRDSQRRRLSDKEIIETYGVPK